MANFKGIIVTDEVEKIKAEFFGCNDDNFDIIAVVDDASECISILENEHIDFVLTDAFMSTVDGYVLVDMIKTAQCINMPAVYFMSAYRDRFYVDKATSLGAKYYFLKPINPNNFYRIVKQDFEQVNIGSVEKPMVKNFANATAKNAEEKLSKFFLMLGIPAHIKGYKYLRDAIKLVIEDTYIINSITKRLYPNIATIHGTSSSKVERAIRHAIEVAWNSGKMENLNKILGFNVYDPHDRPTNSEFIAVLADKILIDQAMCS